MEIHRSASPRMCRRDVNSAVICSAKPSSGGVIDAVVGVGPPFPSSGSAISGSVIDLLVLPSITEIVVRPLTSALGATARRAGQGDEQHAPVARPVFTPGASRRCPHHLVYPPPHGGAPRNVPPTAHAVGHVIFKGSPASHAVRHLDDSASQNVGRRPRSAHGRAVRHLPRSLGQGVPGLEERLEVGHHGWPSRSEPRRDRLRWGGSRGSR